MKTIVGAQLHSALALYSSDGTHDLTCQAINWLTSDWFY